MVYRLTLEVRDAPVPPLERYLLGLKRDTEVLFEKLCDFIVILKKVRPRIQGCSRLRTSRVKPSNVFRDLSFSPTRSW